MVTTQTDKNSGFIPHIPAGAKDKAQTSIVDALARLSHEKIVDAAQAERFRMEFIEKLGAKTETKKQDTINPNDFRNANEVSEHVLELYKLHSLYKEEMFRLGELIRIVDIYRSDQSNNLIMPGLNSISEDAKKCLGSMQEYFEKQVLDGIKIWDALYGISLEEFRELESKRKQKFTSIKEALDNAAAHGKILEDTITSQHESKQCLKNWGTNLNESSFFIDYSEGRVKKLKEEKEASIGANAHAILIYESIEKLVDKHKAGLTEKQIGRIDYLILEGRECYTKGDYESAVKIFLEVQKIIEDAKTAQKEKANKMFYSIRHALKKGKVKNKNSVISRLLEKRDEARNLYDSGMYFEAMQKLEDIRKSFHLKAVIVPDLSKDKQSDKKRLEIKKIKQVIRKFLTEPDEKDIDAFDKITQESAYAERAIVEMACAREFETIPDNLKSILADKLRLYLREQEEDGRIDKFYRRVEHTLIKFFDRHRIKDGDKIENEFRVARAVDSTAFVLKDSRIVRSQRVPPPPIPQDALEHVLSDADIEEVTEEYAAIDKKISDLRNAAGKLKDEFDKHFVLQTIMEAEQTQKERNSNEARRVLDLAEGVVQRIMIDTETPKPIKDIAQVPTADTIPVVKAAPEVDIPIFEALEEIEAKVQEKLPATDLAGQTLQAAQEVSETPLTTQGIAPVSEVSADQDKIAQLFPEAAESFIEEVETGINLRSQSGEIKESKRIPEPKETQRKVVVSSTFVGEATAAGTSVTVQNEVENGILVFEPDQEAKLSPIPSDARIEINDMSSIWSSDRLETGSTLLQRNSSNETAVEGLIGLYDGGIRERELNGIQDSDHEKIWEYYRNVLWDFQVIKNQLLIRESRGKANDNDAFTARAYRCLKMPVFRSAMGSFRERLEGQRIEIQNFFSRDILDHEAYKEDVSLFESVEKSVKAHKFYEAIWVLENQLMPKIKKVTELAERQDQLNKKISKIKSLLSKGEQTALEKLCDDLKRELKENRLDSAAKTADELEKAVKRADDKFDIKTTLRNDLNKINLAITPGNPNIIEQMIRKKIPEDPVFICEVLIEEVEARQGAFSENAPIEAKIIARQLLLELSGITAVREDGELPKRCIEAAIKCGAPKRIKWTMFGPYFARAFLSRISKRIPAILEERPTVRIQRDAALMQIQTVAGQVFGIETAELLASIRKEYDLNSELILLDFLSRSSAITPSIHRLEEQIPLAEFDNIATKEDIENALALGAICRLYMQNAEDKNNETYQKAKSYLDGKVFLTAEDLIKRRLYAVADSFDQIGKVRSFRLKDAVRDEFINRLKTARKMFKSERIAETVRYVEEKLIQPSKQLHDCAEKISHLYERIDRCEKSVTFKGTEIGLVHGSKIYAKFAKPQVTKEIKEAIRLIEIGKIKEANERVDNLDKKVAGIEAGKLHEEIAIKAIELLTDGEVSKGLKNLRLCYKETPFITACTVLDILLVDINLTRVKENAVEEILELLQKIEEDYGTEDSEYPDLSQGATESIARMMQKREQDEDSKEKGELEPEITTPPAKESITPKDLDNNPGLNGLKVRALRLYASVEQGLAKVLAGLPKRDPLRDMKVDRIFEKSEKTVIKTDPEPEDITNYMEGLETEVEINELEKYERGFLNPELIEQARVLAMSGKINEARTIMAKIRELPTGRDIEKET